MARFDSKQLRNDSVAYEYDTASSNGCHRAIIDHYIYHINIIIPLTINGIIMTSML